MDILNPSVVDRTALRSRFSMQIHSNAAKILMLLEKINNVETLIKSKKSKKKSWKFKNFKILLPTVSINHISPIFMVSMKSLRDKNLKRVCGLGRVDLISGIIPRNENQKRSDLINLWPLWSNGPLSNFDNFISKYYRGLNRRKLSVEQSSMDTWTSEVYIIGTLTGHDQRWMRRTFVFVIVHDLRKWLYV